MTHKYEQRFLIDLAFRIAHRFPARSVVAQELSSWVEDQDLGFDWDPEIDSFRKKGVPAPVWANLRKRLTDRVASAPMPKPDVLAENVTLLANHVGLNADACRQPTRDVDPQGGRLRGDRAARVFPDRAGDHRLNPQNRGELDYYLLPWLDHSHTQLGLKQ